MDREITSLFDANIHLPLKPGDPEEFLDLEGLTHRYLHHLPALGELFTAANFMLFTNRLTPEETRSFGVRVRADFPGSALTWLVPFREPGMAERMKALKEAGTVTAVKFHSYVQKITESDFPAVVMLAKIAQSLGMPVMVDTSFGTVDLYKYDNLKLAAEILRDVTEVPVLLLHSGGARCIEAMTLLDVRSNAWMESSYTLPFYVGSSVERDLAFTYKTFSDRILFGSDFPYMDAERSLVEFQAFLKRWEFPEEEVRAIFHDNAYRFFHG